MRDLACVVHLHSLYSDGTGTVPEIARAARASGADVVLLTDHDTLEARRRGEEGWHDGVLVLVGEEVSPRGRNHYLAFGIEHEVRHRGMSAAEICSAVREGGGFGFAAHPFSQGSARFKRAVGMPFEALDCEALHGVELWSFLTDTAERLESIPSAIRFVAAPGRTVTHPPERNLAEWDRLCLRRRTVAIGGLDAHQFGRRVGPIVLRLMSYRRSFRHLRTHVLVEEPPSGETARDRALVYGALREGRCYLAMDSVADARGFSFHAEDGADALQMGAEAPARSVTLRARLPAGARVRLLRDGRELAAVEGTELAHVVDEPGVYRVEARRRARGAERTWILSNPIYLR
ncbi:MAG: CehA/McbA family metallohydrolase [Thermoleophilaceae bacterium]